jgi:hypothetical protein
MATTTENLTVNDYGRITRRRKPTREETLWLAERWPFATLSRYHRANLTPEERVAYRRADQLGARQAWERENFGRVCTQEWNPMCSLPTSALTT